MNIGQLDCLPCSRRRWAKSQDLRWWNWKKYWFWNPNNSNLWGNRNRNINVLDSPPNEKSKFRRKNLEFGELAELKDGLQHASKGSLKKPWNCNWALSRAMRLIWSLDYINHMIHMVQIIRFVSFIWHPPLLRSSFFDLKASPLL